MLQKIKCFFGFHEWVQEGEFVDHGKGKSRLFGKCRFCGKMKTYYL